MKLIVVYGSALGLIVGLWLFALGAFGEEKKISGKPVSEWVERLGDIAPQTCQKAYENLSLATRDDLAGVRTDLYKIAEKRNDIQGMFAAKLVYEKFGKTFPTWVALYLHELGHGVSAQVSVRDCYIEDAETTAKEINKFMAEQAENLQSLPNSDPRKAEIEKSITTARELLAELREAERNGEL